jgi:putative flippase GtrA
MRAALFSVSASVIAAARPVGRGLTFARNWLQLAKFCVVGGSGYVVNLTVYTWLLEHTEIAYRAAAVCSFAVAVSNNYALNRAWTFAEQRANAAVQGLRYLVVSLLGLAGNLAVLTVLVAVGADKVPAQALAIALMTPLTFAMNKVWSFKP